jgi:hypothetical protein
MRRIKTDILILGSGGAGLFGGAGRLDHDGDHAIRPR